MSSLGDVTEQPSAAKPRDLRQDLATAAQQSGRKRKGEGLQEREVRSNACNRLIADLALICIQTTEAHMLQAVQPVLPTGPVAAPRPADVLKRRSTGLPVMGLNADTFKAGRGSAVDVVHAQPASALQYLADKGSRVKALEADKATAQAEIAKLSQQLRDAKDTIQVSANSLAVTQGERDFLSARRDADRQEMEEQIQKAEQSISALRQQLKQSELAQV